MVRIPNLYDLLPYELQGCNYHLLGSDPIQFGTYPLSTWCHIIKEHKQNTLCITLVLMHCCVLYTYG
jgi:hypothetical protein